MAASLLRKAWRSCPQARWLSKANFCLVSPAAGRRVAEKPLQDLRLCLRIAAIVATIPLHNKKPWGSRSHCLLAGTYTIDGMMLTSAQIGFEFYSGPGSGSDVAPTKPPGVQSESPSASGSIPFQPSLGFSAPSEQGKGFSREGWC